MKKAGKFFSTAVAIVAGAACGCFIYKKMKEMREKDDDFEDLGDDEEAGSDAEADAAAENEGTDAPAEGACDCADESAAAEASCDCAGDKPEEPTLDEAINQAVEDDIQ